jgi:hypothetical protein
MPGDDFNKMPPYPHMKTKSEIALDYISGLRAGVEQDIADLDKHWPKSKRGTRANRVFQSLINRVKAAIETAEESQYTDTPVK